MGLYDNYRLANSTRIPEFAGSALPEMAAAKQDLDLKYDTSSANINASSYNLANTPVWKGDEKLFGQVHADVSNQIAEMSQRKDLENLVPDTKKLAVNTAMAIKPFIENATKAAKDVEIVSNPDLKLDATTQAKLLAMNADRNMRGGQTIIKDAFGRMKSNYQNVSPAKAVDINEWADKRVKDTFPVEKGWEHVKVGGQYIIKNGQTGEVITADRIRGILADAYALDPEVQAHVQQQSDIVGWENGKNPSSTYKRIAANPAMAGMKSSIDSLVANNVPLRDAIESTISQESQKALRGTIDSYAVGKYQKNNLKTTEDAKTDEAWLEHEKQKREDAPPLVMTVPGTNSKIGPDETYESITGSIAAQKTDIENLKLDVGQYYKLDANGMPVTQVVNGRQEYVQLKPVPGDITADIELKRGKLEQTVAQVDNDTKRLQGAKNQGVKEATNGRFNNELELKAHVGEQLSSAFNADSRKAFNSFDAKGNKTTISKAEVAKALKNGTAKPVYNVLGSFNNIKFNDGRMVPFGSGNSFENSKNGLGYSLEAPVKLLEKAAKLGEKNFAAYSKNRSDVGTGLIIGDDTKMGKGIKGMVKDAISTNPGGNGLTYYDGADGRVGTSGTVLNGDDFTELDMSKAEIGAFEPTAGGQWKVSMSVPKIGGGTRSLVTVVPRGSNLGQYLGNVTAKNANAYVREVGSGTGSKSLANDIAALPVQGEKMVPYESPTGEVHESNIFIKASHGAEGYGYTIIERTDAGDVILKSANNTNFFTQDKYQAAAKAREILAAMHN